MSEGVATAGTARPGSRTTVTGGTGGAVRVAAGHRVHVVNTLGQQVADTWAVGPHGGSTLSMSHTRLAMGRVTPRVGDVLVDDLRQPMLAMVADTSGGGHDTLIAACDPQRYRALGAEAGHANCSDNYRAALAAAGLAPRSTPDPLNLFMAVPIAPDGSLTLESSSAPAGSEVVFEALQDLVLIVSACPQDMVPISGTTSPPRQIDLYTD
jgi:uncharacterized protein YcgI (DUF1989 family)